MVWEYGLIASGCYCWLACDVTAAMLVVKNKNQFSPQETQLYFQVNSLRNISIVLTLNVAALSDVVANEEYVFLSFENNWKNNQNQ